MKRLKGAIILLIIFIFTITSLSAVSLKQNDPLLNDGLSIKSLSFGNSYIGIKDDVSASVYNPAILGSLQNRQFSGAYSEDSQFKINNLFLGYADLLDHNIFYGIILLRGGTGSIDTYDIGGVASGTSIENNETTGVFSIGFSVINRLSGGVSFKVLNQNLAGYSDTGAGLDMGLYWNKVERIKHSLIESLLYNLEAGIVVKNILGPQLKFRIEKEKEPLQARGGLGYTFDFIDRVIPKSHIFLAAEAVYMEDTQDVDVALGLEFKMFEHIRLRGGYGLDMVRGGLGIDLGKFDFNYGFIGNSELGNSHCVGISMRLKDLRMEKAGRLYQKGLQANNRGEYRKAIEYIEMSVQLEPQNEKAVAKIKEIKEVMDKKNKVEDEETNKSIKVMIKLLPKAEQEVVDMLYYEGLERYYKGDKEKALSFWKKINVKNDKLEKLINKLIDKVEKE